MSELDLYDRAKFDSDKETWRHDFEAMSEETGKFFLEVINDWLFENVTLPWLNTKDSGHDADTRWELTYVHNLCIEIQRDYIIAHRSRSLQ